ncbi:MAG: N-acetyltransferase [Nitrospinota bacterium]|nr:N-acetyltransferase [Nitrospinota bacterium]
MKIRQATLKDVDAIVHLIEVHAKTDQMLFRSREDVETHILNFLVAEKDGCIAGACGLNFGPGRLVEVRSLAVLPKFYRQGIGTALVNECIVQATLADCERIFVLTYAIPLFKQLGFRVIDMDQLPDKIWKDCQGCRKQDHCDETAMIRDLVQVASSSDANTPLSEAKDVEIRVP